ncbi:MAG: carbohydrate ABC transporter permease [Clostridia bacterium]|nr:carbohydrate ABC transporter permease [Clostridia bacterium]
MQDRKFDHISERILDVSVYIVLTLFCLSTVLPFILILIVSVSDEASIINNGYSFFPSRFSLEAYKLIFSDSLVLRAYLVTTIVTVTGTTLSVLLCGMAGYGISLKKVKYRGNIALYFYLPMIFSAGLVPWYLVVTKTLHLKDNIFALILPYLVSPFHIFLFRNYFKTIPDSLRESAEIDGGTPFQIFIRIILPLAKPILATVLLFTALGYWNDWMLALWLIDDKDLYPLQYMLYRIMSLILFKKSGGGMSVGDTGTVPMQSVQVATLFVTIGPIILLYPFVQKYFVKGIMMGAIKE